MTTQKPICLADFEALAETQQGITTYLFYATGADEEHTLRNSKEAYKRLRLRPRLMRDVSHRDMRTTLLGQPVSCPIGISPTAIHVIAHPDAESATVKGADKADAVMILSSHSNTSVEDIATVSPSGLHWMQCYFFGIRTLTERLVRRAEQAGFKALVVTVDAPLLGNRVRWRRVRDDALKRHKSIVKWPNLELLDPHEARAIDAVNKKTGNMSGYNDSQTWEDIRWLKKFSHLPVVVKGILTAESAREAIECGVDGIFVSAHGGRQLDGVPAPIEALPEVMQAVKGTDVEVYIDGGVRLGTDVFKALALGARAVFLGRPILWGLTYNGEDGVSDVLRIMKEELSLTMALMGCRTLDDIKPSMVVHESYYQTPSKL